MHIKDFDFKSLQSDIEQAAKRWFEALIQHHQLTDVYGFALYSDDGAMTVGPAINTLSYLKKTTESDPDEGDYYRFCPAEWQYEGISIESIINAPDPFEAICTRVRAAVLHADEGNEPGEDEFKLFSQFRRKLFETCLKVLENLRQEQYFAQFGTSDFLVLFSVSDGDVSKKTELARMARLNSPALVAEFTAFTQRWS